MSGFCALNGAMVMLNLIPGLMSVNLLFSW
nr:MAG TPA: hypothetical protein [Caudoviricetes sp.]